MQRKIDFEALPWKESGDGLKYKERKVGNHKVRLALYSDQYRDHWCSRSHTGYVLEGRIEIQFPDSTITYEKGDGIVIVAGDQFKHKAHIKAGESATLLLFEPN